MKTMVVRLAISGLFVLVAFCGFLVATGHKPGNEANRAWIKVKDTCPPPCAERERQMLIAEAKRIDAATPLLTMRSSTAARRK